MTNEIKYLLDVIPDIETKIGYVFKNKDLLSLAFIHRSYVNEHREIDEHNERLEFLGDAILGLLISDYLYRRLPDMPEGDLSYLRSRLVEAASCLAYVQKLKLEHYMLLGKGERLNDGKGRTSILADLFEAIIGAIYLDGGIEEAKHFLEKNFSSDINVILQTPLKNWKAQLQDICQRSFHVTPDYRVLNEEGPEHSKIFSVAVYIFDEPLGHGQGSSKKEAQQAAAQAALYMLKEKNHQEKNGAKDKNGLALP